MPKRRKRKTERTGHAVSEQTVQATPEQMAAAKAIATAWRQGLREFSEERHCDLETAMLAFVRRELVIEFEIEGECRLRLLPQGDWPDIGAIAVPVGTGGE